MMIQLDVEEYCQDCPEFEAKVAKLKNKGYLLNGNFICYCETIICCERNEKCKQMYENIKIRKEKEADATRTEAIKEFAERLCEGRVSNDPVVIAVKTELKLTEVKDDE